MINLIPVNSKIRGLNTTDETKLRLQTRANIRSNEKKIPIEAAVNSVVDEWLESQGLDGSNSTILG